jgi:pimeloyl-ACP methyl ester carboxylesterase
LHELVDKLNGPLIVVGLSMGGTITQMLYRQRPEKIRKMVLVSTFSRLRPSAGENLPYLLRRLAQVSTGNLSKQAQTVADRLFPGEGQKFLHDYLLDQITTANPKVYRQCMVALGLFNSTLWMKKCTIPVLVISGDADTTVTLKNQRRLVNTIPNCEHIIISGGGHAVSVDHSDLFNSSLLSFIQ